MAKTSKRRAPVYNEQDAKTLQSVGKNHRIKQPNGTVEAIEKVPAAQRDRVLSVDWREVDLKKAGAKLESARSARVSCLPVALKGLSDYATDGLEGYHSLYFDAQPSQAQSYEPRIPSGCEPDDSAQSAAWDALLACNRALMDRDPVRGQRVARRAKEIVTAETHQPFDGLAVGVAETVGTWLSDYFADEGETFRKQSVIRCMHRLARKYGFKAFLIPRVNSKLSATRRMAS